MSFILHPEEFLRRLFAAAVDAARPERCMPETVRRMKQPKGRTVVVGAGKAAASMARVFEQNWDGPLEGTVVTPYGNRVACEHVKVIEASHPVPDEAAQYAAQEILKQVANRTHDDLVVCLWSGGGSSIMVLPGPGLTLADKQNVLRELLKSGATIAEINCVRKHMSAIKGGCLALACTPARVVSLIISDVPGDDLSIVASGPTSPDKSTVEDAKAVLQRYKIELPPGGFAETPKPSDPVFDRCEAVLLASAQGSLEAAARIAREHGITPHILSDAMEGEARELGKFHGALARQVKRYGHPFSSPCVILSGGEATVTVTGNGKGRGGRNVEFLASLAKSLEAAPGIYALAADTDGIDGTDPVAGALIDPTTVERAEKLGLTLQQILDSHDAHTLFEQLENQIKTGPTLTNVNDFRAILVEELGIRN